MVKTEFEQWRRDKEWQAKANPIAREAEDKRNKNDMRLLIKRRKERLIKMQMMEEYYQD